MRTISSRSVSSTTNTIRRMHYGVCLAILIGITMIIKNKKRVWQLCHTRFYFFDFIIMCR